ncbi:MAG: type II toxin-antitoxin system HicA family toxin [Desulfobacterales bacterium]
MRFSETAACAEAFGFKLVRISGSHHIYAHPGVAELLNLQNVRGMAKDYQIRQLLELIETYNPEIGD